MTAEILSPQPVILDTPVTTSSLDALVIATDADRLDIELIAGSVRFFSVSMYAYDGKVTMEDIGSLIEYRFRQKEWTIQTVTIKAYAPGISTALATRTITCLYCEYDVPLSAFDKTFLSLFPVQRTHMGSVVTVATDSPGALATATVTAVGLSDSGAIATHTIPLSAISSDNLSLNPNYTHIGLSALMAELSTLSSPPSTLRYFTVNAGSRQKTFYVDTHTDYFTVCFRSIFNIPEYIDIPGVTVMTTEVSRSDAYINGSLTQYDQSTLRSYKVTTAPLTRGEAEAYAQIIESRDIRIRIRGTDYPIKVTDHTIEVSYDNANLNTIQFTWRFTGPRPMLFGTTLDPLLTGDDGIFTEEFTPEYQ